MKRKYAIEIDKEYLKSCEQDIDKKRKMVENYSFQITKWIHETEESWIDKQLSLYFSDDFDLYWAYDCYKVDKDWNSIRRLIEEHGLRIAKQNGRNVDGSYLTHLFKDNKLLSTLEIVPPYDLNNFLKWEVKTT